MKDPNGTAACLERFPECLPIETERRYQTEAGDDYSPGIRHQTHPIRVVLPRSSIGGGWIRESTSFTEISLLFPPIRGKTGD
jgi:hypothetical protein